MNETECWLAQYYDEVEPLDFYRGIFPKGELDRAGAMTKGRYTGIVVAVSKERRENGKPVVYRWTMTDELDAVREAVASDCFCLCSPISYIGKNRTAEHARMLYAFAVDVDKLKVRADDHAPVGIRSLMIAQVTNVKRLPRPTYIVSSGRGVHLYYVLDRPIPLYADAVKNLQTFKRELTRLIWHDAIVDINSAADVQQEGIFQGFRMPGTLTKDGDRARAYATGDKVTVDYLNSFVRDAYKIEPIHVLRGNGLSLAEAAEKYPDWYERRVVNGEPRKRWHVKRALYDWWKEQIKTGVTVGHRYFCLMTLAVYAQKCSYYDAEKNPTPVTREELEADCWELMDLFESLTDDEKNHFGNDDVLDALEAFDDRWTLYPRSAIAYKSGIEIPASKRNGLSQEEHLEEARAIRDIRMRRKHRKWNDNCGRKSKADVVLQWRLSHPDGRKIDCIRETGLSKPTVYKYWKNGEEEQKSM